jgi:hypothetical protein
MREQRVPKRKKGKSNKENKVIKKATIILEIEVDLEDESGERPQNTSYFLSRLKNHIKESCEAGVKHNNTLTHTKKENGRNKRENQRTYSIGSKILVKSIRPSLMNPPRRHAKKKK